MSQTATIELQEQQRTSSDSKSRVRSYAVRKSSQTSSPPHRISTELNTSNDALPQPVPSSPTVESQEWNHPRSNVYKVFGTYFSLLAMGLNDAAYGPLIPYLEQYYDLTYTVVSLIFLSPFVGYIIAALCNNPIHMKFGQRGIALIGGVFKIVAYTVLCLHPPYPVLVVIFIFAGFGIGIEDAAWNAWMGDMKRANELLGIMHAFYGLGGTLSPIIATSMIVKAGWPWYRFYYFMIGVAVLELIICGSAFWKSTGTTYRASIASTNDSSSGDRTRMGEILFKLPHARTTWLCAFFLAGYMGCEVSIGGWLVTFMLRVRHADPFPAGMTATGFWLGLTVGRVVLGFVTPRIGEKIAISIYLPISMALQLLFWLVPSFLLSAIFAALVGFFIGPLFPAAIVAMAKLLPKHLHVAAVGFAAAFGGTGAAVLPFAVGAIANATSVKALQPLVLGMMVFVLIMWLCLPRIVKRD